MVVKTDWRINKHGVNVLDLHAGQWVELWWNDSDNEVGLILEVEKLPKTAKRERDLKMLLKDRSGVLYIMTRATNYQVVRILPDVLEFPKL